MHCLPFSAVLLLMSPACRADQVAGRGRQRRGQRRLAAAGAMPGFVGRAAWGRGLPMLQRRLASRAFLVHCVPPRPACILLQAAYQWVLRGGRGNGSSTWVEDDGADVSRVGWEKRWGCAEGAVGRSLAAPSRPALVNPPPLDGRSWIRWRCSSCRRCCWWAGPRLCASCGAAHRCCRWSGRS